MSRCLTLGNVGPITVTVGDVALITPTGQHQNFNCNYLCKVEFSNFEFVKRLKL